MKKRKTMVLTYLVLALLCVLLGFTLFGCASFDSKVTEIKGSITGNTYTCKFYSNEGENFMTAEGEKIDLNANVVKERTYNESDGWGYNKTLSSVVTITIDGNQIENCGSTVIFAEKGLEEDVDFQQQDINSSASGLGDNTIIANVVNKYKNVFGKPTVVVIQSQLGDPICAYSGDKVYWEVCEDLPKTTKLSIDGKALYIHRANFQIIDKDLLN